MNVSWKQNSLSMISDKMIFNFCWIDLLESGLKKTQRAIDVIQPFVTFQRSSQKSSQDENVILY